MYINSGKGIDTRVAMYMRDSYSVRKDFKNNSQKPNNSILRAPVLLRLPLQTVSHAVINRSGLNCTQKSGLYEKNEQ